MIIITTPSAGLLIYFGVPIFSAVALSVSFGLGGNLFVGAGLAVIDDSPFFSVGALGYANDPAGTTFTNFWVMGCTWGLGSNVDGDAVIVVPTKGLTPPTCAGGRTRKLTLPESKRRLAAVRTAGKLANRALNPVNIDYTKSYDGGNNLLYMRNSDLAAATPSWIPDNFINPNNAPSLLKTPNKDLYVSEFIDTCALCNVTHNGSPLDIVGDGATNCSSAQSCDDPNFHAPVTLSGVGKSFDQIQLPDIFVTSAKVVLDCGDGGCGPEALIRQTVKNFVPANTQVAAFEEMVLSTFEELESAVFANRRRMQAATCGDNSKVFNLNFINSDIMGANQIRRMLGQGANDLLEELKSVDSSICAASLLNNDIQKIDIPAFGSQANKMFTAGVTQSLAAAAGDGSVEVYPPDHPAEVLGPNHPAVINQQYGISIDGFVDGDVLKIEARGSKPQTNADGSLGTRTVTLNLLTDNANLNYRSADAPIVLSWTPSPLLADMLVFVRVTNVLTGQFYDSLLFEVAGKRRRMLIGKERIHSFVNNFRRR